MNVGVMIPFSGTAVGLCTCSLYILPQCQMAWKWLLVEKCSHALSVELILRVKVVETVIKNFFKLCLCHCGHAVRNAETHLREAEYLRIDSKTPE